MGLVIPAGPTPTPIRGFDSSGRTGPMATGLSASAANTGLDAVLAAYTWIKLHVGDPGVAGTSNPATETTRKQVTWAAASGGASSNSGSASWPSYPAAEDVTHFTAWSASTAGTFGFSGTVTANPMGIGDTLNVAVGDLDAAFTLAS